MKYKLKKVPGGWQTHVRQWFFFWVGVGPVYSNEWTALQACDMANRGAES